MDKELDSEIEPKHRNRTTIIANRNDGLGERLRAIVNAMMVAQALPGNFAFNWPPGTGSHPVPDARQIFSDNFISRFHIPNKDVRRLEPVSLKQFDLRRGADAVLVSQHALSSQLPNIVPDWLSLAGSCFAEIDFSTEMETARQAAFMTKLDSEKSVALHLRAGDLIYGRFRHSDNFNRKACPFPIAIEIVEDLKNKGFDIVLFGQDANLISYISERCDAIPSTALSESYHFTPIQLALFEICVMSSCVEIVSGSSGFAVLASWISGRRNKSAYNYFKKSQMLKILKNPEWSELKDERVSDFQKAFACKVFLDISDRKIDVDAEYIGILERAIELDPNNETYQVAKSASLIAQGHVEAGERVLMSRLKDELGIREQMKWVLKQVTFTESRSRPVLEKYLPYLEAAGKKGFPAASFCSAAIYAAAGNRAQAQIYANLLEKNQPEQSDLPDPMQL